MVIHTNILFHPHKAITDLDDGLASKSRNGLGGDDSARLTRFKFVLGNRRGETENIELYLRVVLEAILMCGNEKLLEVGLVSGGEFALVYVCFCRDDYYWLCWQVKLVEDDDTLIGNVPAVRVGVVQVQVDLTPNNESRH